MIPKKPILAHRGNITRTDNLTDTVKDNSIEAFKEAFQLSGLSGIEFDIDQSSDDSIFLFNRLKDERLEPLNSKKLFESHPNMPLLEEALIFLKKNLPNSYILDIEVKKYGTLNNNYSKDYEIQIGNLLTQYLYPDQYVITSFWPDVIVSLRSIIPEVRFGLLISGKHPDTESPQNEKEIRKIIDLTKPDFLAPIRMLLNDSNYRNIIELNGKENWVWLVNNESIFDVVNNKNVDFIISDQVNTIFYDEVRL